MKKLISLSLLVVFILAIAVQSTIYIVDDQWIIQEYADETNFTNNTITGYSNPSFHSWKNFTDGDYSTYALVNGTFYMNYSKRVDDYSSLSLWQVKYNASGGSDDTVNHSLSSDCWDQDSTKVILKVNTTNVSNAHYCYSGTWDIFVGIQTEQAVYEESMWWYTKGRTYNISYSLVTPTGTTDSDYYPSDLATINFTLHINDTNADMNHSTYNCSLYTRMNNTASYTVNMSGIVITNNTNHNGTTVTFNDGDRAWWHWGCEDNYSRAIFNTSSRIIDIDLVYYTLSLGATKTINLSLDIGEIVIKGGITVANITLRNETFTTACDATENGVMRYNASDHHAYICNSSSWKALWT